MSENRTSLKNWDDKVPSDCSGWSPGARRLTWISFLSSQYSRSEHFAFRGRLEKTRLQHMRLSSDIEVKSNHYGPVNRLAIEKQDYRYILCGGSDGAVSLYDLEQTSSAEGIYAMTSSLAAGHLGSLHGQRDRLLAGAISALQWYPTDTGAFVSACRKGSISLWDTNAFTIVSSFDVLGQGVNCAALNGCEANSRPLLAVGTITDNKIYLADISIGDSSHTLLGHSDIITAVAWSPSHPFQLASASQDGSMKLWDIRKAGYQALLMSFDWRQDHSAIVSSRFASSSEPTRKRKTLPTDDSILREPRSIDWSRNQLSVAHEGPIMSIQYSSCGRFLMSAGNDKKLKQWNTTTGQLEPVHYDIGCKSELPYSMDVASFEHPADDVLIMPSGSSGSIGLMPIHTESGKCIKTLRGHLGMINSVVYRRPSQQVVSCSKDGLVFVWSCPSSDELTSVMCFEQYHLRPRPPAEISRKSSTFSAQREEVVDEDSWSSNEEDNAAPQQPAMATAGDPTTGGSRRRRQRHTIASDERSEPALPQFFIPPIIRNYLEEAKPADNI